MLNGTYHVYPNALVVGSRIVSDSLINERLVLINLIKFSRPCVFPRGVIICTVEFQSFCMVVGDLEAIHVDRLTAEGVQLRLVSHANQLLLGLGDLLESW